MIIDVVQMYTKLYYVTNIDFVQLFYKMSKSIESIIREAYYDPSQGFTGADKLYRNLQKKGFKAISRKDVKDFLHE